MSLPGSADQVEVPGTSHGAFLSAAGLRPGEVYELCAFPAEGGAPGAELFDAGEFFDRHAISWVKHRRAEGCQIYVQPNPLGAGARECRRSRNADVKTARVLLVDLDPCKTEEDPKGVAPEAREAALVAARRAVEILGRLTGIRPALLSSGRGCQVWAVVEGLALKLRKPLLRALARELDGPLAKVDPCTHNTSRLMRLPGGAPHRATGETPRVLEAGDAGGGLTPEALERLERYCALGTEHRDHKPAKRGKRSARPPLPEAVRAKRLKATAAALEALPLEDPGQRHRLRLAAACVLLQLGVRKGPAAATLVGLERSVQNDAQRVVVTTAKRLADGLPCAGAGVMRRLLGHEGARTVAMALAADLKLPLAKILPRLIGRGRVRGLEASERDDAGGRMVNRALTCGAFAHDPHCGLGHSMDRIVLRCETLLCGCWVKRVEAEAQLAVELAKKSGAALSMIRVEGLASPAAARTWRKLIPKCVRAPVRWWLAPCTDGTWSLLIAARDHRGEGALRSASRHPHARDNGERPTETFAVTPRDYTDCVSTHRFQAHCVARDAAVRGDHDFLELIATTRLTAAGRGAPPWPSRRAARDALSEAAGGHECGRCGSEPSSWALVHVATETVLRVGKWPASLSHARLLAEIGGLTARPPP